jgi:hypothetical protein
MIDKTESSLNHVPNSVAKSSGWRRFSICRLLIGVTLCGVYFAFWPTTKRNAGPDVVTYAMDNREPNTSWTFHGGSAILPLVFRVDEREYLPNGKGNVTLRRHYLWCFGYVWRTPLEYESPFRDGY